MERVAILGGTFNPIHNGHLKLAENALRQFALDSCWFMPAPNPPHKEGAVATDFSDRLAMVRLAIASCRSFRASDFEAGLEGKSYTSRTLSLLRENFPRTDFYFVVGADSFYEIERWHEPGEVLRLAALIVADRDYDKNHASLEAHAAHLQAKYAARIHFIHAEEIDISSARIRRLLASGKRGAERLLPKAVYSYIQTHHLYGQ
ncbi:MAG: nicotinate (nicotinamide) nucleotide adenylyltransferase [Stomatobaculum sp.]